MPTIFSLVRQRPPRPTLFPYTTLFRSLSERALGRSAAAGCDRARPDHRPAADRRRRADRRPRPRDRQGGAHAAGAPPRSEEHTSELQSHVNLVCRLLLEKKNISLVLPA